MMYTSGDGLTRGICECGMLSIRGWSRAEGGGDKTKRRRRAHRSWKYNAHDTITTVSSCCVGFILSLGHCKRCCRSFPGIHAIEFLNACTTSPHWPGGTSVAAYSSSSCVSRLHYDRTLERCRLIHHPTRILSAPLESALAVACSSVRVLHLTLMPCR